MPKRSKKTKEKNSFIDEKNRFSRFEEFKVGDVIVYERVSDQKKSVGEVKWFCMTSEGMGVTVIDQNLGNFQLGLCSKISREDCAKKIKKLLKPRKDPIKKSK